MNEIKILRKQNKMTQAEASELTGIPIRTFKLYENSEDKVGSIKYNYIVNILRDKALITETKGLLSIEDITAACNDVLKDYDVSTCILFGSYAKGKATEQSDVDLLVVTDTTGLKFFGMVEKLRESLHKNVDVLDIKQLDNNEELLTNILAEGKRIYVQNKS